MSNPENELEQLKAQLASLSEIVEQVKQAAAPIEEKNEELYGEEKAAYAAYEAKVAALRAARMANDKRIREIKKSQDEASNKMWQIKMAIRKQEEAIEAKKKAEKEAELQTQLEAQMKILNERWDTLTMGATWREWAKDHQLAAGHFITENRKVILADPMGLGKTLSAIIACDMAEAATRDASPENPFLGEMKKVWNGQDWEHKIVGSITRPTGKRVLYFCPSSLLRNVVQEYRMWAKHRSVLFIGDMPKAARNFALETIANHPEWVVVCNYEAWRRNKQLIQSLADLKPDTVILDEAHNLKDMKSIANKGIRELLDSADPEYVIPMTGTPVLNRPQELFALLNLVNPTKFAHENDFLLRYCEQIYGTQYWKFQEGGLDTLQKQIGKNFLRRTREMAGIILPEKTVIHHDLEVDKEAYPEQARVREQMAKYATIKIGENKAISAAAIIAMYTRLRQIETWPAGILMKDKITKEVTLQVDVEESQKIDYLISKTPDSQGNHSGIIPDVVDNERVVVFSQFKAPLHELKRRIEKAGYTAAIMDGSTPQEERDEIARDFDRRYTPDRNNARFDVVLCNYRVGGVGLNLTAATQLITLDEEWNPGKRDQAHDRIHRIGQEEAVTIHIIRNKNTIDDWLANIMKRKVDMVEGFESVMSDIDEFKEFLDNGGLM